MPLAWKKSRISWSSRIDRGSWRSGKTTSAFRPVNLDEPSSRDRRNDALDVLAGHRLDAGVVGPVFAACNHFLIASADYLTVRCLLVLGAARDNPAGLSAQPIDDRDYHEQSGEIAHGRTPPCGSGSFQMRFVLYGRCFGKSVASRHACVVVNTNSRASSL